jgi:CheY-like chemotaxis protein
MTQETILIVDDNESVLESLTFQLAGSGYRTIQASDGLAALDKATEERPALILLDLMMPGLSGFEVLERMQEDPQLSTIPVIVVTVLDDEHSQAWCLKLGARGYVTKPYDYDELLETIRDTLTGP